MLCSFCFVNTAFTFRFSCENMCPQLMPTHASLTLFTWIHIWIALCELRIFVFALRFRFDIDTQTTSERVQTAWDAGAKRISDILGAIKRICGILDYYVDIINYFWLEIKCACCVYVKYSK